MKTFFFTILALVISPFFLAPTVFAQNLPCGNIIGPDKFGNIRTIQIEDCADPFKVTTNPINNYNVIVDGVTYEDGATITVTKGGTNRITGNGVPIQMDYYSSLYKHDGNDYRYIDLNETFPTPEYFYSYIDTFFTNENDRQLYLIIVQLNQNGEDYSVYLYNDDGSEKIDETTGETISTRLQSFYTAAENNFVPTTEMAGSGTYTLVITESSVYQTNNTIWDKIRQHIIPTAYAQFLENFTYTISFTLVEEGDEPEGASSVLFLPGIQASRLYKNGLAGSEDQIWVPDGNQDVRQLEMNTNGVSQNQVYTRNILEELPYTGETVYDSFSQSMINLMFDGVIKAWAPYAYDWRYSVNDVAINGTKYEQGTRKAIDLIQNLASSSFTGKVTIIGHSNGGLLAKAIVKQLEQEGKTNLVDRVILLASPQLGTPKAIGTILHGYDQEKLGGWAIDDVVARDVIQNMPGAYGLVTSQSYFNNSIYKVIRFENSTTTESFRTAYGTTIDSEEELRRFMIGNSDNRTQATTIDEVLRVNETMLNSELDLHKNILDSWTAPDGIEVIEVVGTGLDTVSGFEYRSFKERVCSVLGTLVCTTKDFYKPVPIISQNGDKTVMALSAQGYNGTKEKYFIDLKKVEDIKINEAVEHYNISENPSIQKLIKNILLATTTDIEFISKNDTYTSSNRILLAVHSPVDIEAIATNGRRVGKTIVNGVVGKEESIPGSTYFEIGSSKYIIVPADENLNLKLKGAGDGGLTFSVDKLNGAVQVLEVSVRVATITASTSIKVGYNNNQVSNLEIDVNGDTVIDTILTPQGVDVTPKITYKTLKDKINSFGLSSVRKLPLLLLVEAAELLDKQSIKNPKLAPAEIYALTQIETLAVSYQKKNWITQKNLDDIRFIISKLK